MDGKIPSDITMTVDHRDNTDVQKCEVGEIVKGEKSFKAGRWGRRHEQCLVLFFSLSTAIMMRACMGVALVAMVSHHIPITPHHGINLSQKHNDTLKALIINETQQQQTRRLAYENLNLSVICNISHGHKKTSDGSNSRILHYLMLSPPYPTFSWSKRVQDAVLSSFGWGYMMLQLPGGALALRFGPRRLLCGAFLANGIVAICLPWAAFAGGWWMAALCRWLQGLSQACIMPSIHTFLGRWAPLNERARLSNIVYGGFGMGLAVGMPITGFLSSSWIGWPGVFRIYGLLSVIACILLWLNLADFPAQHARISMEEKLFILDGLKQKEDGLKVSVPWSSILRSVSVWAIVGGHIGLTWAQLTLYNEVPSFMNHVMKVNIKANGVLSALPFLANMVSGGICSIICDALVTRRVLSVGAARKLFNSIGSIGCALGLVCLALAPKTLWLVETLLVLLCALKGATSSGFHINHIDVSPEFAGTLMSISNFVSNTVGSVAPLVAGLLLTDVTSEHSWRRVFYLSAGFMIASNFIFVAFGSGKRASWDPTPTKTEEEEMHSLMEKKSEVICKGSEVKKSEVENGNV